MELINNHSIIPMDLNLYRDPVSFDSLPNYYGSSGESDFAFEWPSPLNALIYISLSIIMCFNYWAIYKTWQRKHLRRMDHLLMYMILANIFFCINSGSLRANWISDCNTAIYLRDLSFLIMSITMFAVILQSLKSMIGRPCMFALLVCSLAILAVTPLTNRYVALSSVALNSFEQSFKGADESTCINEYLLDAKNAAVTFEVLRFFFLHLVLASCVLAGLYKTIFGNPATRVRRARRDKRKLWFTTIESILLTFFWIAIGVFNVVQVVVSHPHAMLGEITSINFGFDGIFFIYFLVSPAMLFYAYYESNCETWSTQSNVPEEEPWYSLSNFARVPRGNIPLDDVEYDIIAPEPDSSSHRRVYDDSDTHEEMEMGNTLNPVVKTENTSTRIPRMTYTTAEVHV